MFANIFLLSLLTIIYGTKCDEGGGSSVERNSLRYQPELSQQRLNDGEIKLNCVLILFPNLTQHSSLSRFKLFENREIN